jgi:hypothetical protein
MDFHFVRERVAQKMVEIWFISTGDQLVDWFTKALQLQSSDNSKSISTLKVDEIEGGC